jgi:RimJ/RimL family protein N-acetyltransferase
MITLRAVSPSDAPAVANAVHRSREALRRWMPWYRDDYDRGVAEMWIEQSVAGAAAGTDFQFAILDPSNAIIGVVGFEDLSSESGRAMLGYWLATDATGRGIGRQAIALALDWARWQPAFRLIWAVVAEPNRASRRVLEVNGFRLVGPRGVDERGDTALIYELDLLALSA